MAWGVKRTKLEEMLDEKRHEVGSLSAQQDTGRLRQLEREIRYLESICGRRSPGPNPRNGSSQDVLH